MQDYGRRVGHGSGFWFYQSGRTVVSHNLVVEGPRDAFGVYGDRLGCQQTSIYGESIDFWSGLRALHTSHIEIAYNQVSNVIRGECTSCTRRAFPSTRLKAAAAQTRPTLAR